MKVVIVQPSLSSTFTAVASKAIRNWRFVMGMLVLMIGATGGLLAFGHGRVGIVIELILAGLGVLVGGLLLALFVYVTTSSLSVEEGNLCRRSLFSQQQFARPEICRVVRRSVTYSVGLAPERVLFVLTRSNRVLFYLFMAYWGEKRLEPIWRRLEIIPEGSWDDLVPYDNIDFRAA